MTTANPEEEARKLLAQFVPKEPWLGPDSYSILRDSPHAIVYQHPMWRDYQVWNEAAKLDTKILQKLFERLERYRT